MVSSVVESFGTPYKTEYKVQSDLSCIYKPCVKHSLPSQKAKVALRQL